MRKFRLLDLCCGAGGAAMGYFLAGFDVTGVDILPQKNYPFEFIQADALDFDLTDYDVVHASPPCQAYSRLRYLHTDKDYPLLIPAFRKKLVESGKPYVIENVPGSGLVGITLSGAMFGLDVQCDRKFESNVLIMLPNNNYRHKNKKAVTVAGHTTGYAKCCNAMGIDWMKWSEITQAIPPAYTKHIGQFLLQALEVK